MPRLLRRIDTKRIPKSLLPLAILNVILIYFLDINAQMNGVNPYFYVGVGKLILISILAAIASLCLYLLAYFLIEYVQAWLFPMTSESPPVVIGTLAGLLGFLVVYGALMLAIPNAHPYPPPQFV